MEKIILNWYLIGVMVNLFIIYIIIVLDKFIYGIEQKMDKKDDILALSLLLIVSWSVWLFVIIFFLFKDKLISYIKK